MKEKESAPEIELYPDEWKSELVKPREPILGSGLPVLFKFLALIAVGTFIKVYFK